MKILLLAPEPFYQERGTPIAVDLVLRALSARGESVDVLTYPEGRDVAYPGVCLRRIPRLPFMRRIRPGPSLKKIWCDLVFFVMAVRLASRGRYDFVHAVEESVFMAMLIRRCFGVPYLYDMDSCLSEQLMDTYRWLKPLGTWLRRCEAAAIREAVAIVPVCQALADVAARHHPHTIRVLHDVSLLLLNGSAPNAWPALREELDLRGPVAMYIGNLERYQGLGLLLDSFAMARARVPEAHLVVVGGAPADVQRYRADAKRLGLEGTVTFLGHRPVRQLPRYVDAADVLVSPRLQGRNTPMKIYSYLHSGKPILATDLVMHTQVLTADVASLCAPTPTAFADALVGLLTDAALRQRLGNEGRRLAEAFHTLPAFRETLNAIYDGLRGGHRSAAEARGA